MVLQLVTEQHGNQVSDLRKAYDMIIGAYAAQNHGTDCGLQLGWPYLDTMTGGLHLTDMVSMVGRPGIGKTWQMLYCAHHGWQQAEADPQNKGESRMFVSMEMSILAIEQRLAALHTHVPFSGRQERRDVFGRLQDLKKGLKEMQGFKAPFWIVDGNLTATVDDLYLLAKQLKPDAIFIDGAYLVKNTEREGPLQARRRQRQPDQDPDRQRDRADNVLVAVFEERDSRRRRARRPTCPTSPTPTRSA